MISEYFLSKVMYYISTVFIQGDRTAEFGGLDCSCENEYNKLCRSCAESFCGSILQLMAAGVGSDRKKQSLGHIWKRCRRFSLTLKTVGRNTHARILAAVAARYRNIWSGGIQVCRFSCSFGTKLLAGSAAESDGLRRFSLSMLLFRCGQSVFY